MHQVERLVDVAERHFMGDEIVDIDLVLQGAPVTVIPLVRSTKRLVAGQFRSSSERTGDLLKCQRKSVKRQICS
jgi:hypothetical protein